jgi:O-antigen/teichoic acid export membrane protein
MAVFQSRWLLNSGMNVLAGASAALVNFGLPPILARFLPESQYALWNLILPVVAYLGLFGSGVHLATAKFLSEKEGPDSLWERQRTVSAGFCLALLGAALALGCVFLISRFYPTLYPRIAPDLSSAFSLSILCIGGSAALQILALLPLGVFTGHQQNASYVGPQVLSRAATLAIVAWGASLHWSLPSLALAYALAGFLLVPLAYTVLLRTHGAYAPALRQLPDWGHLRQLLAYCGHFSLWSIGALLIHSLDTVLVGRFELSAVNPYALALALTPVLSGLLNALASPLLPGVSALYQSPSDHPALARLLLRTTFWASVIGQSLLLAYLLLGKPFFQFYAAGYAQAAHPFFCVLLLAFAIRHVALPYSIFLLGCSLHAKALPSIFLEGALNLGFSLLLAPRFGALGVAYGTLLGTIAGQLALGLHCLPQTRPLAPNIRALLIQAFLRPFLWLSPAYVLLLLKLTR